MDGLTAGDRGPPPPTEASEPPVRTAGAFALPGEPTAPAEVDYADDAVIAREESIRDLGRELDALLAAPLLGPAKVTIAWEAGLRSMQEYRDAPFERIESLVGFGRPVAASLWTKLGRPVPSGPLGRDAPGSTGPCCHRALSRRRGSPLDRRRRRSSRPKLGSPRSLVAELPEEPTVTPELSLLPALVPPGPLLPILPRSGDVDLRVGSPTAPGSGRRPPAAT